MATKMDERSFLKSDEFKKYRKFAFRDDMLKFSVGVMLGNSFNKVIQGMSDYLVMPVATYMISSAGSGWREIKFTPVRGLDMEIGRLAGVFVDFTVVSIILYLIYIKLIGRLVLEDRPKIQEKACPHCFSSIHPQATKCPMCTGGIVVKERRTRGKDKGTKGT